MKVVCLKACNAMWESQILGSIGETYYAPKWAWGNDAVGIHLYHDVKMIRPVSPCILKERLVFQYETTDEMEEGIEVLAPREPFTTCPNHK